MQIPHPSGIAVDRRVNAVHVASTRNPNQIVELRPAGSFIPRGDVPEPAADDRPLLPLRSRFLPGSLYIHELALVGDALYANAVGHNAIVHLPPDGGFDYAWWPRCVDRGGAPDVRLNHIQLNSIAAGSDLAGSYYSASGTATSRRRPGHLDYPVRGRGVVFSGATREPIAGGLTRPHSARLHKSRVWVANSGFGELGYVDDGAFEPVARFPGWTRGLCFVGGVAFVGVSRVIPRYRGYAPGLDVETSRCGVFAVDDSSGAVLGSFEWPQGNQIFAVDWVPAAVSLGFAFGGQRRRRGTANLFYTFSPP